MTESERPKTVQPLSTLPPTKCERPTAETERGESPSPSLPPLKYPKVVEHACRVSTREILVKVLEDLERSPDRTAKVNLSSVSRDTKFHRRTVARALAFGIRFKVLQAVDNYENFPSLAGKHPGTPQVYKSLWKLSSSSRAPSPKNPYKVQSLASTKTGLRPSISLRKAAMVRIRESLAQLNETRLVSAYGRYIWSKSATVRGISTLVKNPDSGIAENSHSMPLRRAFATALHLIYQQMKPYDAMLNYTSTLQRDPPKVSWRSFLRKPTVANNDDYEGTLRKCTSLEKSPPKVRQSLREEENLAKVSADSRLSNSSDTMAQVRSPRRWTKGDDGRLVEDTRIEGTSMTTSDNSDKDCRISRRPTMTRTAVGVALPAPIKDSHNSPSEAQPTRRWTSDSRGRLIEDPHWKATVNATTIPRARGLQPPRSKVVALPTAEGALGSDSPSESGATLRKLPRW